PLLAGSSALDHVSPPWRRWSRPEVAVESDSDLGERIGGEPITTDTSPMKDGLLGPKLALRHTARVFFGAQPGPRLRSSCQKCRTVSPMKVPPPGGGPTSLDLGEGVPPSLLQRDSAPARPLGLAPR